MNTPWHKLLLPKVLKTIHRQFPHNEFCHFQRILANLKGNAFWAVEISSLSLSRNIQEHSEGEEQRQSHYSDPTREIQEGCRADAWWWATIADNISWLRSTSSLRNRTQRTRLSLSILALWWPSAPGIAAMWAWLHSTISVCSATWHWEAGIRWLHYCKWPAPVTHTSTRTHVCAFATTHTLIHTAHEILCHRMEN